MPVGIAGRMIAARIEREAVTAIDSDSKTGVRELIYQEAA